jgi:hypothetical protein
MKSADPFAQLQRYMQAQKKKERQPKVPPVQSTPTIATIVPPAPVREFQNANQEKTKHLTPNFIENRSIRSKTKVEDPPANNQAKFVVRPSPMRLHQNNTKDRVMPSEEQLIRVEQASISKQKIERSVSQKSYDFVADRVDFDEERLKRLCVRRQKLVEDYQVSNDYWNRDTPLIVNEISKSFSKPESAQSERNFKEIWEDPKLVKMKERMNYHKEQLKNKESNAVLKGRSQVDVDKNIEPVDPFYLKTNTPDKRVRLSNLEGQRIKAIFNGNPSEETSPIEKEWARGKSPGLISPIFNQAVNNIIPTDDSNPGEKRLKVRAISPLKYKYDFCSQINTEDRQVNKSPVRPGQDIRFSVNPESAQVNKPQPKNARDRIEGSPAFGRRMDTSPDPRNLEKRELVLTPSRKNLMNEYWAKMNVQSQSH